MLRKRKSVYDPLFICDLLFKRQRTSLLPSKSLGMVLPIYVDLIADRTDDETVYLIGFS